MKRKPKSHRTVKLAKTHIDEIFKLADKNKEYSNRYLTIARKIAMKFRIKLKSEQKRRFCKHCYTYLVPGKNLRVRVHDHKLIYYCLECKKFWRKPIGKKFRKN